MLYDGKKASHVLREELEKRVTTLSRPPILAVLSVTTHPSITSFITIKRKFANILGVTMKEYDFPSTENEEVLITKIQSLCDDNECDGIIVQLPLPKTFNVARVLRAIPTNLDVDVLGNNTSEDSNLTKKFIPPVAGAIAHILQETQIDIDHKKVVIIGRGRLVGAPVATWFAHQGVTPDIIDIDTDISVSMKLYKEADIVVSGIGRPRYLKPEYFKEGVVLIDAGTSEQGGVLAGDCDPLCANVSSVFTPVPGGVGPLTVAFLFHNVITSAERRERERWNYK